jgi:hypothetical protein
MKSIAGLRIHHIIARLLFVSSVSMCGCMQGFNVLFDNLNKKLLLIGGISFDSNIVAQPAFTPSGGTYNSDQSVIITCATGGADIHYTTDGFNPNAGSPLYSGAISVAGHGMNMTIKAIALRDGMTGSTIASESYSIQYPGLLEDSFNNGGTGANGTVYTTALQADGKIIIGGEFTTYNGSDVPDQIVRLNTDGSVDSAFNNGGIGADDTVYTITLQSDEKMIIGGEFTTYNGLTVPNRIIRIY